MIKAGKKPKLDHFLQRNQVARARYVLQNATDFFKVCPSLSSLRLSARPDLQRSCVLRRALSERRCPPSPGQRFADAVSLIQRSHSPACAQLMPMVRASAASVAPSTVAIALSLHRTDDIVAFYSEPTSVLIEQVVLPCCSST